MEIRLKGSTSRLLSKVGGLRHLRNSFIVHGTSGLKALGEKEAGLYELYDPFWILTATFIV